MAPLYVVGALLFLLSSPFLFPVSAQIVRCDASIYIDNMEEYKQFAGLCCSSVNSLHVLNVTGLSDFSALSGCLQNVFQTLRISDNPNLVSLAGLEGLGDGISNMGSRGFVAGDGPKLEILNNPLLFNVSLPGLTYLSSFTLDNCPAKTISLSSSLVVTSMTLMNLAAFSTFPSNTVPTNALTLSNLPLLTSMPSLPIVSNYPGFALTVSQTQLTSLEWFNYISLPNNYNYPVSLTIQENTALTRIGGFQNITSISNLTVTNNSQLVSLSGLDNVQQLGNEESIGESLSFITVIDNNSALTSIDALSGLLSGPASVTDLRVSNNPRLASCLNGLCALQAVQPSGVTIETSNNGPFCDVKYC